VHVGNDRTAGALVDNDPQTSLTQGVWGPEATAALDPSATIAAVYAGDVPSSGQVVRPTGIAGVDLLPGSRLADQFNVPRPHLLDWERQAALREVLDEARPHYDLVLVDCPPNLYLASWAAMVASDAIIVPCQCEDYGSQGLEFVRESLALVLAGRQPAAGAAGAGADDGGPAAGPAPGVRAEAANGVRAGGLRRDDPARRRVARGHQPAAADPQAQAQGRRGEAFAALAAEVLERLEAQGLAGQGVAA
jgi:cellulose biosynthesis protein BcsQ